MGLFCKSTFVALLISLLSACQTVSDQQLTGSGAAALATKPYQLIVPLGEAQQLNILFSYPNTDNGQTLAQTIEHYLNQQLQRDHISGEVAVMVTDDHLYQAHYSSSDPAVQNYFTALPQFLTNGQLAAEAVIELKQAGKWNEQEWRFFLPLGLALLNQRAVQLLHFPPDYSLWEQDYLNSKTSRRWEDLLRLNRASDDQLTLLETILDVAPIAAPASAGSTLEETYAAFQPYVVSMLPMLAKAEEGGGLPVVAYGGPVRKWVANYFKVSSFNVNTQATITLENGTTLPILGANHPSYIWYAKDQGRGVAMKVMQQDLVSACWEVKLGVDPQQGSEKVLDDCSTYWQARPMQVCINMEIQAFDKSESEARQACIQDLPRVADSDQ